MSQRVLVVDDDESSRYLLQQILQGHGYVVDQAANGIEALSLAHRMPPDLVVSDILMPEMDGFALCHAWRKDELLRPIPFVFYTATYTEDKDSDFALSIGADLFLIKPQEPEVLLTRIQELINRAEPTPTAAPDKQTYEAGHIKIVSRKLEQKVAELEASRQQLQQQNHALKLARNELDEERSRLRTLLDTIPDLIWLKDLDGRYLACNRMFERFFGATEAEIIGKTDHDFVPHDLAEFFRANDLKAMAAGRPSTNEETITFADDGHQARLETIKTPMRDPRGEVVGVLGIARDITHTRQIEDRLRLQGTALEATANGIVITDQDGTIEWVNQAFTELTGYSYAEAVGKNPRALLKSGVHEPEFYEEMWASLISSKTWQGELVNRRKDGSLYHEFQTITAVPAADGHVGHYIGIKQDITDRIDHEAKISLLNRILRTISICNEDLVRAHSEPELLQAVCQHTVEFGGFALAWVSYPATDEELTTTAHFGDDAVLQRHEQLTNTPLLAQHSPTYAAWKSGTTTVCTRETETDSCRLESLSKLGVDAVLALPLVVAKDRVGVLTVATHSAEGFSDEEIKLLEELGADLAYGIVSLRTVRERDQYLTRTGTALRSAITAISRTLEMRDPYTAGHQQRVTALAVAIARKLSLEPATIEGLYFGCMIHDIGKIAVPAEILSKPDRLTELEYQLIQRHAEAGYDIVSEIEFPWPIAQMILQHHERLDGSGYPNRLHGDDIIIEARILTVADVVEAMSSHRPYRPGLGIEAALDEISRGAGTRYDTAVAGACLEVVRENGMELPKNVSPPVADADYPKRFQ